MNALKELRLQLSLSQVAMAHCLGISRSQVAMAELGRRGLDTEAANKLHELEQQFLNGASAKQAVVADVSKINIINDHKNAVAAKMLARINECKCRVNKLGRQLAKMVKHYEASNRSVNMLHALTAGALGAAAKGTEHPVLKYHQLLAFKKFLSSIDIHQIELQAKMDLLNYEADFYRALYEEHFGG